jgi:protein-disulfide isomerase
VHLFDLHGAIEIDTKAEQEQLAMTVVAAKMKEAGALIVDATPGIIIVGGEGDSSFLFLRL